jgi:4-hydroxy-tetrahydrodipicolinate synthase
MTKREGRVNQNLFGIMPPTTTPFTPDGELDERAARQQAAYMVDRGVHCLVVGGSTGEGQTLEVDEVRRLVAATIDEVGGRIPVVAGIIVVSTRQAVAKGRAVADLGVAALQVTPVHYLFRPDDDAMLQHFRTIAEETGLPLFIYNVVPWSYLSPELLVRIMDEVPGVIGVKQSAGDLKLYADLMISAPKGKRLFSAVDALIDPALALGAHGIITAMLAAAPGRYVEMWNAVKAGDHAKALGLHERLLPLWNAIWSPNMCACVKYAQNIQGCPGGYPRAPMPEASAAQQQAIREALAGVELEMNAAA